MKKIFSFLLLLLFAVGAKAETVTRSLTGKGSTAITTLVSGGEYVFQCNGQASQTTYMCAGGTNNGNFSAESSLPTGADAMRFVWRLEQNGSTWKIINAGTGKELTFESTANNGRVTLTDAGTDVTIEFSGNNVGLKNAYNQYVDMGWSGASPCTWSGGVGGSRSMTIYEANISEVTTYAITYNYKYNDTQIGSKTYNLERDQSLPATAPASTDLTSSYIDVSLLDFTYPTGTVSTDATFDIPVAVSSSFPVELGTVTDGKFMPGTKFYTMKLKGKFVCKDANNDYFTASSESSDNNSDAYLFAMTGDIANGFNLYNTAVGAGKVIYDNNPVDSNNDPIPTEANPNGKWSIGKHPSGKIWMRQGNSGTWYMNSRASKLGFWNSSSSVGDGGSEIEFAFVKEVPVSLTQTGKIYTIKAKDAARGVLFVAEGSDKFDVCGGTLDNAFNKDIAVDANNANQQFAFVEVGSRLYLYNVGQKKFATRAGGKVGVSYIPSNYVTVVESDTEGYVHIQFDGTDKLNISTGYQDGCAVLGWNQVDDGNRLQITEVIGSSINNETLSQFATASMALSNKIPQLVDPATLGQGVNTMGSSLQDYADQYNSLRTAFAAINGETTVDALNGLNTTADELISSIRLNMPEPGKFYRFKNSNKYLTSNLQEEGDYAGRMKMEDASTAFNTRESIFFLTEDNKLVAYANGQYTQNFTNVNTNTPLYGFETVGSDGHEVSFADGNVGSASPVYHISCGGRYIYGANANSVLDAGNNAGTNTGYDWTIEKVEYLPVVVSEPVNYGTLYTPVALSLRPGLTAYTGTIINGEWLHLNSVDGVIPAGSAVVLKNNGAQRDETTGHIYLQLSNSDVAAAEGNALTGQTTTIARVANAYTLQNNTNSGLGFYPFSGETLAGFKAYMVNGSSVRGFAFQEGETTSIEAAEGTQLNEPIYDLSGRRVQKATKGLFIVGGKKVFIK